MRYLKIIFFALLLFPFTTNAQIIFGENAKFYNSYNNPTEEQFVGASWKDGTIVLNDDSEITGDVRGYTYRGSDINSFRYRKMKGEKAQTFKADDCKLILYDDLRIISLPKNLKKMSGKKRFFVAMLLGEHLTIFQDPDANTASSGSNEIILNEGQMLNFLALKDGEVSKLTKMNFRKQIKKLCSDNAAWVTKSADKKWLKYDNMYEIAAFYNASKE